MRALPQELQSWTSLLWVSFRGVVGIFVGVAGLFAGLVAWLLPATEKVPLAALVASVLVLSAIIFVLIEAVRIVRIYSTHPFPNVRVALPDRATADSPRLVLILDSSPLFATGLMVSAFVVEHDYESFFAEGVVQNIQDDGLIQVRLEQFADGFEQLITELKASNAPTLKMVRIKPYVHQRHY